MHTGSLCEARPHRIWTWVSGLFGFGACGSIHLMMEGSASRSTPAGQTGRCGCAVSGPVMRLPAPVCASPPCCLAPWRGGFPHTCPTGFSRFIHVCFSRRHVCGTLGVWARAGAPPLGSSLFVAHKPRRCTTQHLLQARARMLLPAVRVPYVSMYISRLCRVLSSVVRQALISAAGGSGELEVPPAAFRCAVHVFITCASATTQANFSFHRGQTAQEKAYLRGCGGNKHWSSAFPAAPP